LTDYLSIKNWSLLIYRTKPQAFNVANFCLYLSCQNVWQQIGYKNVRVRITITTIQAQCSAYKFAKYQWLFYADWFQLQIICARHRVQPLLRLTQQYYQYSRSKPFIVNDPCTRNNLPSVNKKCRSVLYECSRQSTSR